MRENLEAISRLFARLPDFSGIGKSIRETGRASNFGTENYAKEKTSQTVEVLLEGSELKIICELFAGFVLFKSGADLN